MSHIYDNWEKLVVAVLKREHYWQLCHSNSLSSVSSDIGSSSSTRYSFDIQSDNLIAQTQDDGHFSSPTSHLELAGRKQPKTRFGKIAGVARLFFTSATKVPQDITETVLQRGCHALSLEELKEKTYNFGPKAFIGEGYSGKRYSLDDEGIMILENLPSYGRVYLAHLDYGKSIAVRKIEVSDEPNSSNLKLLPKSYEPDSSNLKLLPKDFRVLRFKHENIVELLDDWLEGNVRILAYEFATMGSLHNILHGRIVNEVQPGYVLNWIQRVRISVDVAMGLEYLHFKAQPAIIHGNIRSTNVLLFEGYKAKIAEPNLSNQAPDVHRVTYWVHPATLKRPSGYHPPEYAKRGEWTTKSDIYSFGIVLLELLTGRKAIDQHIVNWRMMFHTWKYKEAAPLLLDKNYVQRCVDPNLKGLYPPEAVAKFAAVAARCVQRSPKVRPDMHIVVKDLQSLLEGEGQQEPVCI